VIIAAPAMTAAAPAGAVHTGGCHCGAVRIRFRSTRSLERTPVRRCQCGFCLRHGARTVTDAAGSLEIDLNRPGDLRRYRFGLRTADYLLCAGCGVYVAAIMIDGSRACATINANLLDDPRWRGVPDQPADYGAEDAAARRARRRCAWTPVAAIAGGDPAAALASLPAVEGAADRTLPSPCG
jgi:hypothetical protein